MNVNDKTMNTRRWKIMGLLLVLLVPFVDIKAAEGPTAPCEEFRKLLDAPTLNGIERYGLEKSIPIGGKSSDERYFNIDIDGDDISDVVTLNCSSSSMPADPCELSIKLSSGKKIEFTENRFYLIRFRSKVYAVTSDFGAKVSVEKRKIYRIDESGVKLVCPNL